MKWIGKRISFVDSKDKTTIVIVPEKNAFTSAMMGAWLAMWITVGIAMVWSMFHFDLKKEEYLIIGVILLLWTYYLVRVTRQFLWLMWGKEMLKLDTRGLVYKKDVKGYGKAILYFYENMAEIEVNIPKQTSIQYVWEASPWISGGERLQFEYQGKFIRFGRKLEEKEIKQLLQLLVSKRNEYAKIARKEERKSENS